MSDPAMRTARGILEAYLQRTGLRQPSDAAQQYQAALLRQWTEHLDEVLAANEVAPALRLRIVREFIYGAVPQNAEAELRVAMHADMTYWAQRAQAIQPDLPPVPGGGS